jgi:alkylated DNA repair dioxygenase AlkB
MSQRQLGLFPEPAPTLPDGFSYQADAISPAAERDLVDRMIGLEFKEFELRGFLGKRRVVSFGWQYDYNVQRLQKRAPMLDFLEPLRDVAARFAGLASETLEQALVTEYSPGVAIGWHRDRPMFGDVVGISLLSPCLFRLRRKDGSRWQRASLTVEPRSIYLLRGPAREEWEHSIPAVDRLRYSVTFRTFRADAIRPGVTTFSSEDRLPAERSGTNKDATS